MLPSLPIVLPMVVAAVCLMLYNSLRAQQWIAVFSSFLLLVVSTWLVLHVSWYGIQSLQMGGWGAPFGISILADMFGVLMVWATAVIAFSACVYSLVAMRATYLRGGYVPVFFTLITGVNGAFLTADIFNMFVWFEVMLISSFVLLSMGGSRPQAEGSLKYVALNLLSSIFFLTGVGLLYALTGSLNMVDLGMKLKLLQESRPDLILAISLCFMMSFGLKAGVFPLYSWLPASYHTPPVVISAVFAGLLTKVGVYAFFRVFTLVFPPHDVFFYVMTVVAILTMLTGVLGAISQMDVRKILSFHIISQIGYMMMGVALLNADDPNIRFLGLSSAIFYIIHHIIVKSNLFLVGGVLDRMGGTQDLKKLGGFLSKAPLLSILFLIPALSLAGIPPLSGFWAKLGVLQASMGAASYGMATAALAAGILTLVSMMKIWNEAFWKKAPAGFDERPPLKKFERVAYYFPIIFLGSLTLSIGFQPTTLFNFAKQAASQMQNPSLYESVFGISIEEQLDEIELEGEDLKEKIEEAFEP